MVPKRIAVVGASIAGLGAAWRLARRGFAVSVFERTTKPGGRAQTTVRDGFTIESQGAIVSSADRALCSWIGELGLSDELLPVRPVTSALVHHDRPRAVDPRSLLGIARIPGIRLRDALRLPRLPRLDLRYGDRVDPSHPERAAEFDDRSLADFGRLYFGPSVMERWMSPLVSRLSIADARDVSRVLFLHQYRAGAGAHLGLLRGALGEVADRAAAALSTRFGVEVIRVERRPAGVRLVVRNSNREQFFEADAAIVATSAPDSARTTHPQLSLAERDAFAKVRYLPSVSLAVALRRPFAPNPQYIQFPHVDGSPLEAVCLESGLPGGRAREGRGLALLRATSRWSQAYFDAPEETLRKELIDAFGRVVPRIRGAALFSEILRVPQAVPRFEVGRYREIADFTRLQADWRRKGRRLYFAGDYLMGPGWDAALRDGYRAAAAVEADLGTPTRSPT